MGTAAYSIEGLKKKLIDKGIFEFQSKCADMKVPPELSEIFKNIILKEEEPFKQNFSELIHKYSQGKLN